MTFWWEILGVNPATATDFELYCAYRDLYFSPSRSVSAEVLEWAYAEGKRRASHVEEGFLGLCLECRVVGVAGDAFSQCIHCGKALRLFPIPLASSGGRVTRGPSDRFGDLSGAGFEKLLQRLFQAMGFRADLTAVNDYGADLLLVTQAGISAAVQAKNYSQDVGVAAVQEVLGGRLYYGCPFGIVVSSAPGFTVAAVELTRKDQKLLIIDQKGLVGLLIHFQIGMQDLFGQT